MSKKSPTQACEATSNESFVSIEKSVLHLLHRAEQSINDQLMRAVGSGITPRQLIVLMAVAANEGSNHQALSAATGVDRSTISDVVNRMDRRGLVEQFTRSQDSRSRYVKLTEEGRAAVANAAPKLHELEQKIGALLTRSAEEFVDDLARITRLA